MLRISLAAPLLAVLLLEACSSSNQQTPLETPRATLAPRSFSLGISSLPTELTEDGYADAFGLSGSAGEVILIQRTPPWEELLGGAFPSAETAATTQLETDLASENGLRIFVAIDPTDASVARREIAGLPPELSGAGFADERIREAFLEYARYVAVNYQPDYLALGVEINEYERDRPEDFDEFVTLYAASYDTVKALLPESAVFPTFQLEELHGLLPVDDPRPPQWNLIQSFEPRLDLLAVSSYPGLAFASPEEIPDDYFNAIRDYTNRSIAISGMGYPSRPAGDDVAERSEEQQAAFLRRALAEADSLAMGLVVWFVGQDPSFTGEGPLTQLQSAGLLRLDGATKPAWLVWREAARRPLPNAAGRTRAD